MLVVLIAGALGSGKTTLLLSLAEGLGQEERRVGILENDVGEVPVDASFLRRRGFTVEDLRSGCICCDLSAVLPSALDALRTSCNPEVLLVEPSGVAAPGLLRKALEGLFSPEDQLVGLYLIDMVKYEEKGGPLSPFFLRALATADCIVASKSSRVRPETMNRLRSELTDTPRPIVVSEEAARWGYAELAFSKIGNTADPGAIQGIPTEYSQPFAASYTLRWIDGTTPEESRKALVRVAAAVRDGITAESDCRLGTVKMIVSSGGGSMIGVSDETGSPTVNAAAEWETVADRVDINVVLYGENGSIPNIVYGAFSAEDGLIREVRPFHKHDIAG